MTQPKTEELKASTIRIPEELWEEASHEAIRQRTTFNDIVSSALREYFARRSKTKTA